MPIIKPMKYSCECGWSAVKLEGDVSIVVQGSRLCPKCDGVLDETLGGILDLLNPVKRIRGLRLDFTRKELK